MNSQRARKGVHAAVIALCCAPLFGLIYAGLSDGLGANPIEKITHVTGEWALRFLLLTLAITPLRTISALRGLASYRRSFGLCAFGYASLHLSTYVGFDLGFAFSLLGEDILERPYITVGFAAFCMLAPLAATSTRRAIRRLGRHWVSLHRLVYSAAICAVVHFFWLVKADNREPLIYAGVLAALLGARAIPVLRRMRSARRQNAAPA